MAAKSSIGQKLALCHKQGASQTGHSLLACVNKCNCGSCGTRKCVCYLPLHRMRASVCKGVPASPNSSKALEEMCAQACAKATLQAQQRACFYKRRMTQMIC